MEAGKFAHRSRSDHRVKPREHSNVCGAPCQRQIHSSAIMAIMAIEILSPGTFTGSFAPWRAGGRAGNHLSHSSFMPAKSSSSARMTVALTALSRSVPAASRMAAMLRSAWAVCSWIDIPTSSPVSGEYGAVPETNTRPPAFTAWLKYGDAFGSAVDETISRDIFSSGFDCRAKDYDVECVRMSAS